MTTEHRADDALRALVREPVELSKDGLHAVLAAIPDTPQERSSLRRARTWGLGAMSAATWQRAFVGEEGYTGLVAIVVDTWRPEGGVPGTDIRLDGFIVEGDLPEAPDPWSAASDRWGSRAGRSPTATVKATGVRSCPTPPAGIQAI